MKIIQVTGMRPQKYGGLEKYFVEMGRQLLNRGDELLLIYDEIPCSRDFVSDLKRYKVRIAIRSFRQNNIVSNFIFLFRLLMIEKPDVVHFHFGKVAEYGVCSCILARVPMIYRSIQSMLFTCNSVSLISRLKLSLYARLVNRMVCVSHAIKRQIDNSAFHVANTCVHYTGTDMVLNAGQCEYKIPGTMPIKIACVAFHGHVKGIDTLLKALFIVKYEYSFENFELHQIGGGDKEYRDFLERETEELGLQNNVMWHGLRNDVSEVLQSMHIYVQPSRSEGMGMALMEAAAVGLPLIGSNIGGIPEIVHHENSGLLVSVSDATALAKALMRLIENEDLRSKYGKNAKLIVKRKFDLHANVKKLISELYNIV